MYTNRRNSNTSLDSTTSSTKKRRGRATSANIATIADTPTIDDYNENDHRKGNDLSSSYTSDVNLSSSFKDRITEIREDQSSDPSITPSSKYTESNMVNFTDQTENKVNNSNLKTDDKTTADVSSSSGKITSNIDNKRSWTLQMDSVPFTLAADKNVDIIRVGNNSLKTVTGTTKDDSSPSTVDDQQWLTDDNILINEGDRPRTFASRQSAEGSEADVLPIATLSIAEKQQASQGLKTLGNNLSNLVDMATDDNKQQVDTNITGNINNLRNILKENYSGDLTAHDNTDCIDDAGKVDADIIDNTTGCIDTGSTDLTESIKPSNNDLSRNLNVGNFSVDISKTKCDEEESVTTDISTSVNSEPDSYEYAIKPGALDHSECSPFQRVCTKAGASSATTENTIDVQESMTSKHSDHCDNKLNKILNVIKTREMIRPYTDADPVTKNRTEESNNDFNTCNISPTEPEGSVIVQTLSLEEENKKEGHDNLEQPCIDEEEEEDRILEQTINENEKEEDNDSSNNQHESSMNKGRTQELSNALQLSHSGSFSEDYYIPGIHKSPDIEIMQQRSQSIPGKPSNENNGSISSPADSFSSSAKSYDKTLSIRKLDAMDSGNFYSDTESDNLSTSDLSFNFLADLGINGDFIGMKEDHFSTPDVSRKIICTKNMMEERRPSAISVRPLTSASVVCNIYLIRQSKSG